MNPVAYTSTVDYSASNEYVRAHYNQSQYFHYATSSVEHQFHDGRILQSNYHDEREMLNDNGLAIIDSPITKEPKWSDLKDIQSSYLPQLEEILHKIFPSSKLLNYWFWNPMIRGESHVISRESSDNMKTPTANIASLVHIDQDVGAYESIQDFLDIVGKNSASETNSKADRKDVADAIIDGKKRFAVVNFWRNIGDAPVSSAPLAILSTRYDKQNQAAFPNARPDMRQSTWYVFPNATRDDVIVFYQYDRNMMQPSDLWHCAISTQSGEKNEQYPQRRSFDIRAFVVLDESVPEELDRFSSNRTRPVLTLEESGCFCDEQAAIRDFVSASET
jgi:hypothetical protein